MTNIKLKKALKNGKVTQWQLAEALNTNEFSLSRKLRNELSDKELKEYLQAIENIIKEREVV